MAHPAVMKTGDLTAGDAEAENGFRVLKKADPLPYKSLSIGKIARSYYYIHHAAKIRELADDLINKQNIFAVGVVDDSGSVMGIIVRRDLFDLLGKQFGRDLHTNKSVVTVMKQAPVFDYKTNIFSVSEELSGALYQWPLSYYVLTSGEKCFAGIFSTRDMLIFLSQMTKKDIDLARRLQRSIVKEEKFEDRARFRIVAASAMAQGVGGDFYAIDTIDQQDTWLIAVCDVSGKGIAASLLSAIIGGMFRIYDFTGGLKSFIMRLNDYIFDTFENERFITGAFVQFNERTGELGLYDLGHSYIYILRDGRMSKMTTRDDNVPLGIKKEQIPRGARFTLVKNDILVILTDGLVEQTNPEGEEYGMSRFSGMAGKYREWGIMRIKDELLADIHSFRKNQPQHDDMTLVLLEYKG